MIIFNAKFKFKIGTFAFKTVIILWNYISRCILLKFNDRLYTALSLITSWIFQPLSSLSSIQYESPKPDSVTQIPQPSEEEALCNQFMVSINSFTEEVPNAHYVGIFPTLTKVSTSSWLERQGILLKELPPECEYSTLQEIYINTNENNPSQ